MSGKGNVSNISKDGTSGKSGKSGKEKPIVKVPKSKVGRAVFTGAQAVGVASAIRSLRAARAKGDKLAFLHAVLNAALAVVTVLVAVRTVRETKRAAELGAAEPLMLPSGTGK